MKRQKKLLVGLTMAFAFCFLFANVLSVQAFTTANKVKDAVYVDAVTNAKGNWVNTTKHRINTFSINSFEVEFGQGAQIRNLKSNKKGLEVKQTEYYANRSYHNTYDANGNLSGEFRYGSARISLYATKTGSYKVTFDVYSSAGVKLKKYTVNVLAVNDTGVIKTATLGKTKLRTLKTKLKKGVLTKSSSVINKVNEKSGKLKFTANTKYKITGFVVKGVNKNGKAFYKKYKNGKNIKLSEAYAYKESDAYDNSSSNPAKKYTYIYVSYKDTFTGDTCTYSVSKKRGKKEIVRTYKEKNTGKKTISYDPTSSDDEYYDFSGTILTLWNY